MRQKHRASKNASGYLETQYLLRAPLRPRRMTPMEGAHPIHRLTRTLARTVKHGWSVRQTATPWEIRYRPPRHPNAHFLGWWFPLTSNVFWTVMLRSWNAPTVPRRAPSNHMVGTCGSSLMTNAKPVL